MQDVWYYKGWRQDKVAKAIHWGLCEKLGFEKEDKWYNQVPKLVLESEKAKILWDFKINKIDTDR